MVAPDSLFGVDEGANAFVISNNNRKVKSTMKDEMKESQPPMSLTAMLAAMMGGKGLQEILDEVQGEAEESIPDEQLKKADELMQGLWDYVTTQLATNPLADTGKMLNSLNMVVWDRIGQWQADNGMTVGKSAHVIKYAQAMEMLFDKLTEHMKRQMAMKCDCPDCTAERAAKGEPQDESPKHTD